MTARTFRRPADMFGSQISKACTCAFALFPQVQYIYLNRAPLTLSCPRLEHDRDVKVYIHLLSHSVTGIWRPAYCFHFAWSCTHTFLDFNWKVMKLEVHVFHVLWHCSLGITLRPRRSRAHTIARDLSEFQISPDHETSGGHLTWARRRELVVCWSKLVTGRSPIRVLRLLSSGFLCCFFNSGTHLMDLSRMLYSCRFGHSSSSIELRSSEISILIWSWGSTSINDWKRYLIFHVVVTVITDYHFRQLSTGGISNESKSLLSLTHCTRRIFRTLSGFKLPISRWSTRPAFYTQE